MYDMMRQKNNSMAQRVVDFAQELVQSPSPSTREDRVADKVESRMKQAGFDRVVRDEAGNVVGVMLGSQASPTLLLAAHMDTVDGGDETQWAELPCSGSIREGRLFGLGASDCKAGLACQIGAAELLKRCCLPLRGSLVVAATVAEENGAAVGVRTLVERTLPSLELQADHAILAEPTGLNLYYGHDGWLEMDIRIEGVNHFHVGDAAGAIFKDLQGGSRVDGGLQMQTLSEPRFETDRSIRRATIGLARRLMPGEQPSAVVGQVEHAASLVAQGVGSVAVEVAVCEEVQQLYTGRTTLVRRVTHSWAIDPFHPLMERSRQALAAANCRVKPGRWQLGRLGLGTAGGVLVNEKNIPTICYGPGDETAAHAPNESVSLEALKECTLGTASIAQALVGIPVFGWTADEI